VFYLEEPGCQESATLGKDAQMKEGSITSGTEKSRFYIQLCPDAHVLCLHSGDFSNDLQVLSNSALTDFFDPEQIPEVFGNKFSPRRNLTGTGLLLRDTIINMWYLGSVSTRSHTQVLFSYGSLSFRKVQSPLTDRHQLESSGDEHPAGT
jgi:hypothetical protein